MKNGWENKYKIKKVTGIKRFYVNDAEPAATIATVRCLGKSASLNNKI